MSAAEWDATGWDEQRALLEGLENDDSVPFGFSESGGDEMTPGVAGPTVRSNVDAGTSVIDLAAMRAELEGARK